jgi:tetratricopeptide (TPR) repeat protein
MKQTAPTSHGGDPDAWVLHSEGRQFGPMSADEIRRFFTSGMIKASDRLSSGDPATTLSPAEAAALLGLDAPVFPAAAVLVGAAPGAYAALAKVAPTALVARPLTFERVDESSSAFARSLLVLWAALILAAQFYLVPKGSLGLRHSLREFIGVAFGHWLVLAAVCFALAYLLAKLFSGKFDVKAPLLLMTFVTAALLGNQALHPEPMTSRTTSADVPAPATSATPDEDAPSPLDANLLSPPSPSADSTAASTPAPAQNNPPATPVIAPLPPPAPESSGGATPARDVWEDAASDLFNKRDWQELEHYAQRWTREQPSRGRAWMYLGLAEHNLRKFDESLAAYTEAVRLAPNDQWVLFDTGVLYTGMGDTLNAIEMYHRALQVDPYFVDAWNNLGASLSRMKRHEEAIAAWQNVLHLDADHVLTWNNLGFEYYMLNQFDKSIECYQKALAINPASERAKTGLMQAQQR